MEVLTDTDTPRILLVEDDRSVARILRLCLRDAGFEVTSADSGGAALELLQREPISAVVLDLGLPDGRGGEVLDHLRERDPAGNRGGPQWVVMTAQDRYEASAKYGPLGQHFLAKPFDPWDLVHLLRRLLPAW